jgi:Cu-Zn family superoxide dismutase
LKHTNKSIFFIVFLILLGLTYGCKTKEYSASEKESQKIETAIAVLHPTKGNKTSGIVKFNKVENGIKITGEIKNLSPGKHGFHIHEYGDCSVEDGTSAGGHFNPFGKPHGAPSDTERHVGDLGNITADKDGTANFEMMDTVISFTGKSSIIGRAVIVHKGEDDLKTQPTGNAGPRVACGVIGVDKDK